MKPAPFDYHRPDDLKGALALLASHDGATILAGGQSLVPMMNYRLAQPDHLVDINHLSELDYIREDESQIVIGALARHRAVQSSPVVAQHLPLVTHAYEWIAHKAVRNRGTLCGNLCHADPASEMPAIVQVLEASMVLARDGATREVSATEFFVGTYETLRDDDEMLVEVRIPKPAYGTGWGFEEVSMRKGDFAWTAIVCTVRLGSGKLEDVSIAAAGVGAAAMRLGEIETMLTGQAPTRELFEEAAATASKSIDPYGSAAVTADYKRDLVCALLPRALASAVDRAS